MNSMNEIRRQATSLLHNTSSSGLIGEAERRGYVVIEFGDDNPVSVENLIDYIGVREEIKKEKGFIYNGGEKLLFLRNGLSEAERRIVLAHELGHIVLGRYGSGVEEEFAANEFAHYLLHPTNLQTIQYHINKSKRKVVLLGLLVLLLGAVGYGFWVRSGYYVTRSGTHYHRYGCTYLNSSARRVSNVEGYEPCSACIP